MTTFILNPNAGVEVLRLTQNGIWANPDVPPDEAAKLVLAALDFELSVLVQEAVKAEREACAKVCDEMEKKAEEHGTECCKWPTPSDCAYVIRARGNT
jgi:hypothetical protein